MKWTHDLDTSIAEVDFQHKHLINLINELEDLGNQTDPQIRTFSLRITFEKLIEYTIYHFALEEELMSRSKFPQFEAHKKDHALFRSRLEKMGEQVQNGSDVSQDVLDLIQSWWKGHIRGADQKFSAFYLQNNKVA